MKINLCSYLTGLVLLLGLVGVAPIEGQDRAQQSASLQAPPTSEPGNAPTTGDQLRQNQATPAPYSPSVTENSDRRGGGFSALSFIIGMVPGALIGYFLGNRQTPAIPRDRAA